MRSCGRGGGKGEKQSRERGSRTLEIGQNATILPVQAWMGHADVQTTMKYMHHRSRADAAWLLSGAFRPKKKRASQNRAGTGLMTEYDESEQTVLNGTSSSWTTRYAPQRSQEPR
jgi:hypothetical protein